MAANQVQHMVFAVVFLMVLMSSKIVEGLQCYQCSSVEIERAKGSLLKRFAEKSDPNCESAGYGTTKTKTCSSSSDRCGLIKAQATFDIPLIGKHTVRTVARDCMPSYSDGCDDDTSKMLDVMGEVLSFVGKISDLDVSGKLCYCNYDNCVAGGCLDGEVALVGQCVAWYYVLIGVGLAVALGFLLTCCCCCCCRCCRSKPRPMPVVTTYQVPGPVIVNRLNTDAIHGVQNPGYGDQYTAQIHRPM